MHSLQKKLESFERVLNVMDELREKCPWDKKQTLETLRNLTIEETYELADAIMEKDFNDIKKELGDLLLHIVFYSKIASEQNHFDIADVADSLCEKLIFRHPHVFGDIRVNSSQEVVENWEDLKRREGHKSVLGGVPPSLPAMIKANRVQEKAGAVGFDWDEPHQIWDKVKEEISEVEEAVGSGNQEFIEAEFGDLFFSLINAARLYDVDPETALEKTNKKFIKRFRYLEKETLEKNFNLREMSLDKMNEIWERAKQFD